jgi:type I restriction enzyme S subunit
MIDWPVNASTAPLDHPRGWKWVPITNVAQLVTGHTPDRSKPDYWNGGVSWINLNEIRQLNGSTCNQTQLQISASGVAKSSAVIHPAGTVCMSRTASVGFVTKMGRPMTTSQDFVNWIPGPEIDSDYLMKALVASRPQILELCSGSTHKTMYVRDAERLRVLLPPIAEQRRIVALLDAADALRDKRRQALAKLDTLAEAVFIDMFGPLHVNRRAWPIVEFGAIVRNHQLGLVRGAKELDPGNPWPYIRMNAIRPGGELDLSGVSRAAASIDEVERHKLEPGDLLFNTRNARELVGKTAIFRGPGTYLFNNNILRLRLTDDAAPEYVNAALRSPLLRQALDVRKVGTTSVFAIYYKALKSLPLPLPPIDLQRVFSERMAAIRAEVAIMTCADDRLHALFASIQQRAFRGEL